MTRRKLRRVIFDEGATLHAHALRGLGGMLLESAHRAFLVAEVLPGERLGPAVAGPNRQERKDVPQA